ncbi:bifunctional 4-hydroxy-2-oxoglutarate aldolase/2-dehydro-3-deoxy-phosphogluconate aldolase [Thorsellia kenyensis]|uniref:2-dehydro-3-deoxy-phosphogluconate aldolase n=1 Tax=Thorsellia kenyensis TaxID=1549888 RepID=A0ABV6CC76_9GAMM
MLKEKLSQFQIVPVIVIENKDDAYKLGQILMEEGLPVAEITFRTKAAAESIRIMRDNFPELLIGAGTVLTGKDVKIAKEAGVDFIVSPGFNPRTIDACRNEGIPIVPGANNPTAIEMALELDVTLLKFFPAEASGGVPMIKALLAPYQDIYFMPTGGITITNIQSYLSIDRVVACGGSWMVNEIFFKEQNFDKIRQEIKTIVTLLGKNK